MLGYPNNPKSLPKREFDFTSYYAAKYLINRVCIASLVINKRMVIGKTLWF